MSTQLKRMHLKLRLNLQKNSRLNKLDRVAIRAYEFGNLKHKVDQRVCFNFLRKKLVIKKCLEINI